jgi:RNA polymerase sigma factor (sigma-70 family)
MLEEQQSSLVTRIQQADSLAQRRLLFDELVREHGIAAYGYALTLIDDVQSAEDATQEAFLVAYRELDQLRDPAAFAGWLRRIVHSQCHRLLRTRGYAQAMVELVDELPAAEPSPDQLLEQEELQERVRALMASLPDGEQMPLALYYFADQSQRQIADALGLSLSAVKKRLERARHRLAERMQELAHEYRYASTQRRPPATDSLSALLTAAALEGQFVLLETLLVEGMDVNEPDANGETLLHWAAREGHLDAVELLLSYHPNLTRRNRSGRTAMEVALDAGQPEVVDCLRRYEKVLSNQEQ